MYVDRSQAGTRVPLSSAVGGEVDDVKVGWIWGRVVGRLVKEQQYYRSRKFREH